MPNVTAQIEVKAACDTSYRANNLDIHLTHGCIALFRHLLRVRSECAWIAGFESPAILAYSASALRTRIGGTS